MKCLVLSLNKKKFEDQWIPLSAFLFWNTIVKKFFSKLVNKIGTRRSLFKQPDSFSYRSSACILKCNWILLSQTFTSTHSGSHSLALFLFQYPSPVYKYLPFSNAVFPLNIRKILSDRTEAVVYHCRIQITGISIRRVRGIIVGVAVRNPYSLYTDPDAAFSKKLESGFWGSECRIFNIEMWQSFFVSF